DRRVRGPVAVAGSDSHAEAQPVGRPHTVVHASGLSANAVVEALRRGRSYLVESAGVSLDVTAMAGEATAGPGEELAVPAGDGDDRAVAAGRVPVRAFGGVAAAGGPQRGPAARRRGPGLVAGPRCAGSPRARPAVARRPGGERGRVRRARRGPARRVDHRGPAAAGRAVAVRAGPRVPPAAAPRLVRHAARVRRVGGTAGGPRGAARA